MLPFRPSMHPKRYMYSTFGSCTGKPPPSGLLHCCWIGPWHPELSFDTLGGIFIVRLTLIPHRTTFGKDRHISGPGRQFLATKNGPPGPVLALNQFFFVTAQITSSSIPFLLIYLPPHKLCWGMEVLIAISLLVCVSCRWINFNI